MTKMRKEWAEVTPGVQLDEAVDFWDIFILLTKKTYEKETRALMLRPTPTNSATTIANASTATAKFKAAYKVSAAKNLFHIIILSLILGFRKLIANGGSPDRQTCRRGPLSVL